jgi:hypothetical protein
VYLPAAVDYHFDPKAFPPGIDKRTGDGFYLDSIPGRVLTKYPCGEAILRLPFYLVGKLLRARDDPNGAGFTLTDHAMVDVAASFYGVLGLLLLFLVLNRRVQSSIALSTVLAILVGTNLLFYLIGDPGMSHVYSFFLFAAFISVYDGSSKSGLTLGRSFLLGLVSGLVLVTRPINILFIPLAVLLMASSWSDAINRIKGFRRPRVAAPYLIGGFIMCIPQMAYWQYVFGSPIKWSYGNEGFTNLLHPQVIPFWFAPENGLFPYSPLILLVLVTGLCYRRTMRMSNSAAWITFLVISYISASWFAWGYGCGFGSRNFVEYGVVFAFPLANLLNTSSKYRWILATLILICSLYTLKLTFSCAICWFGNVWDWHMFLNFLTGPII